MRRSNSRHTHTAMPLPFARKRFGQHFLTDAAIVDATVHAIDPQPGQSIVEIGPGRGALTAALLQRVPHITAIELDRDLATLLRAMPRLTGRLTLIEGDALHVDWDALRQQLGGATLRVVGNLPYNISTPLLLRLLGAAEHISDQHFMLQREVAQRISAPAGSSAYGRLSVMLQWRYAIETVLERIPPAAFTPAPKVESAVIRMTRRADAAPLDATILSELLRCAFSQRRKLLRHTLAPWLQERGYSGTFDLQRRAQEVPAAEYFALAQTLPAVSATSAAPTLFAIEKSAT